MPRIIRMLQVVTLGLVAGPVLGSFDGVPGEFCGRGGRPTCCQGRQDDCSFPVLNTLCYCDVFCYRRNATSEDCCPDYRYVCDGLARPITTSSPPARKCSFQGSFYEEGDDFKVNCNKCTCRSGGDHMELDCGKDRCLIEVSRLSEVNRDDGRFGWRAQNYSSFWGLSLNDGIQRKLGTLHSRRKVLQMRPLRTPVNPGSLPQEFDARSRWPGKISPPADQGDCAASWAFSTVSVASDRAHIMSKGSLFEPLSYQHLLDCNAKNQRGCSGGFLSRAWAYIKLNGLVPESCYPWSGVGKGECRVPKSRTSLSSRCHRDVSGWRGKVRSLYRMGPVYRVVTEQGIMQEIMKSGPVQATMKVHPDFFMYDSGIFRCEGNHPKTGFTSVRIIGWGHEIQRGRDVKYWIVANSWGEDWGERGHFRIQRGTNECQIEDFILGAWLDTRRLQRESQDETVDNVLAPLAP